MAKRIIAIEESGCVDGVWQPKPTSLERPPEVHRIAWAELDGDFITDQFLQFGRWQPNDDDKWHITSEMVKI